MDGQRPVSAAEDAQQNGRSWGADRHSQRILIVDDEEGVRLSLGAVLDLGGYSVATAATADEALDLQRTRPFDLVITDLHLETSDQDGVRLLERIRGEWPDTQVVVLTGYASVASAITALRVGAFAYLTKPCDVEELKLTTARALEHGTLGNELRRRVTELEQANANLARLTAQQQQRIDDATAALRQKVSELEATQRHLEDVQRLREEFVSLIVHELRGPMTGMYGYAHLLADPKLSSDKQARARDRIVAAVRRLSRLIDDLTDANQLQAGRFKLQIASIDLVPVLREQVEQTAASATRHTVELEAPETLPLACDRDRLSQVIGNLLENALKYTPGGVVLVRATPQTDTVRVAVSDAGPAVPQDKLEEIFKPHVRLPNPNTDGLQPRGSGLGLYICRGIVEAHGGRMWAEHTPAGGTAFILELPRGQA